MKKSGLVALAVVLSGLSTQSASADFPALPNISATIAALQQTVVAASGTAAPTPPLATATAAATPTATPPPPTATPTASPFSLPTLTPTATPAPAPSPTAGSAAYFGTSAPGSSLPDNCASLVRRSSWEPRPENYSPNHTTGITGVHIDGASPDGDARLSPRIDGNFTGTTDEIIQWGACKWGFDEDTARAVAAQESWWRQSTQGNCNPQCDDFGLMQVRASVHKGTYPTSASSTAFNVDFALAWRRACYEGYFSAWVPAEARGDDWGCVGLWYSGRWKDAGAQSYVASVQDYRNRKVWLQPGF